jgi:hypothetical protein
MIGAGGLAGLGIAPPPGVKAAGTSVPPGAPPPAAGPSSLPPAPPAAPVLDPLADTGRNPASFPPDSVPPEPVPPAAAARAQGPRDTPRLPSAPRLDDQYDSDPAPAIIPGRKGGPIVAILLGGVMVLLVLAYFIARFLGLAS